jgi:uncharacterized cofD-like protein
VLASRGRIYPSTHANVSLEAETSSTARWCPAKRGSARARRPIHRIHLKPKRCRPLAATLAAIEQADLICLGPGSLFTSVVPKLLVEGIPEAIHRSPARKAYFCNLMWQPGETINFTASDHIAALHSHASVPMADTIVINTRPITGARRRRYAGWSACFRSRTIIRG